MSTLYLLPLLWELCAQKISFKLKCFYIYKSDKHGIFWIFLFFPCLQKNSNIFRNYYISYKLFWFKVVKTILFLQNIYFCGQCLKLLIFAENSNLNQNCVGRMSVIDQLAGLIPNLPYNSIFYTAYDKTIKALYTKDTKFLIVCECKTSKRSSF